MKTPLEYHDPHFQQELLRNGNRQQLIAWLRWNDPNGIYADDDSVAEDRPLLTLHQAREILYQQTHRDLQPFD